MESNEVLVTENGSVKDIEKVEAKCSTFEDILQKIKPFGLFQIGVFAIISLSDVSSSMCLQFFIYGAANPGYACIADGNLNESDVIKDGMLIKPPANNSGYLLDTCEVNGTSCLRRIYSPDFTSIITEVKYMFNIQ